MLQHERQLIFLKPANFAKVLQIRFLRIIFMNLLVIYVKFVAQLGRKPFVATLLANPANVLKTRGFNLALCRLILVGFCNDKK